MSANLTYGPPMNTDSDYYQTFSDIDFIVVSDAVFVAIIVERREASVCLIMLSTKHSSHTHHF